MVDGTTLTVPGALAGERVLIRLPARSDGGSPVSGRPSPQARARPSARPQAELAAVRQPSPERADPPCPHAGSCGGCATQHWQPEAALAWKRSRLHAALTQAGFAGVALQPPLAIPPGLRRRAVFSARRRGGVIDFGLHAIASHDIVPITACIALLPALSALIPPMLDLLTRLEGFRAAARISASMLADGADLLLHLDGSVSPRDRQRLADFAGRHGVLRISAAHGDHGQAETLVSLAPVRIGFGGPQLDLPPAAFLQASAAGETAIREEIISALQLAAPKARQIAELYAGCGSFSFALAGLARVSAYEGNDAAAASLAKACAQAPLSAQLRDLHRQPLLARELGQFDAIVLDPPWDGAGPQMPHIAASLVPAVVYVSCNPAALARDAGVLARGGYSLVRARLVDQFPWTAELESICLFTRPRTRRQTV